MRLVKIVAGIVGVLVVVVVGVLVYASTLDVNQYKPLIQQKVLEATGREVAIRGDLKMSVGLSPAIAVDGVSFANAPWGEKRPMASIERFEAQVSLLPLIFSFGKNIVIDRLVLRGADILLETDAQGKGNWEFQPAGAQPAQASPSAASSGGAGGALPVINVVELRNVKLLFRDGKEKKSTALGLEKALLTIDGSSLNIDVAGIYNKLGFAVTGKTGRLVDVMGIGGGGPFPVDVALALGDRVKATVKGRIAQVQQGKGYDLTIAADIPELGKLSDVATDAGVTGIAVPALGPLKGEFRVTDQAPGGAPSLPALKLTLGAPDTMRIALEGAVKDPTGLAAKPLRAPGANITFSGDSTDLAKLAQRLGQTSPISGPMKLTGKIADQGTDRVALTGFKFEAAGSDLGGDAQLSIAGARPALTGAFQSAKLDLAKLSGGGGGGAKPAAAPARGTSGGASSGGRVFSDDPLPLDAMKSADADVKAKVTELVLPNGMIAKDVRTELVIKDGNLVIDTIKALFGGGSLDGDVRLAQTGAFAVKFKADGLDLGTLVREASGADNLTGGKTDVDLDVRSTGKSVRQLMAGLNGKFALTTGQGAIKSAYVDRIGLDDLMAIVNKALPREDSIRLNCVVSRIDIANGVATHRTMVIDTARMTATGEGRINLASEQLDMRADTKTKVTSLLSALPPILIKGTLANPSYQPDIAGAALGAAGALAGGASGAAGGAGNLVGGLTGALTGQRPSGGGQQASAGGDPCAGALGRAQPASAAPAADAPAQAPAQQRPAQQPSGGGGLPGGLPNPFRR